MTNLISMDKKYKTRDGKFVRVLCVDNDDEEFPVIASIKGAALNFTSTGAFHTIPDYEHPLDLIETPQEHSVWVEVYSVTKNSNTAIRYFSYASYEALQLGITANRVTFGDNYQLIATKKITVVEGESCL